MITASRTALAALCLWPFRPDVTLPRSESSPAAALGVEGHGAFEATIKGAPLPTLSDEARAIYQAWLDGWWQQNSHRPWQSEVAYALNPIEGTAYQTGVESRGYAKDHGQVPGTADAVLVSGRVGYVVDFKTGREAPPARDNAQLLTLATAMRLAHGLDAVRAAIVHVRPEGVTVDEVVFDEFDLDSWLETLGDLVRALPTAEAKPGPHCRALYCAGYGACPSTSESLVQISGKPKLPIVTDAGQIRDNDHAAYIYEFLRQVKAREALVWGALREWADTHGGIPLGDGRAWQRVDRHRESIDLSVPGAIDALRAVLGPRAENAIELSVTKAAIELACREIAKETNSPIKHVVLDVMNALRDVGAARPTKSVSYEEREAK